MAMLGDKKTLEKLKAVQEAIGDMIEVYEKDEDEVTAKELESMIGKLMISLIALDSLA